MLFLWPLLGHSLHTACEEVAGSATGENVPRSLAPERADSKLLWEVTEGQRGLVPDKIPLGRQGVLRTPGPLHLKQGYHRVTLTQTPPRKWRE